MGFEAERTAEGGDEGDVIAGGGDAATPGGIFRTVMRRVPPFPAFGKRGDILFRRGRGTGDGQLFEAFTGAAMPAQGEATVLLQEARQAIDDHEALRDFYHTTLGLEAREAEVRGGDAVELPAHLTSDPRQPEKAPDSAHGVKFADRDDIVEAGAGETIPTARGIVRIRTRVFGDPLAVPAERDVQLVGVRGARAKFRRGAEEERAARMAKLEDAGIAEFGRRP